MSNNTKHTPGPWKLVGRINGDTLSAYVFGKDPSEGADRELEVISMKDSHPIKEHLQRRFADMKLIAAAPELLEAAINVLEHKEGSLSQLQLAIKKATE